MQHFLFKLIPPRPTFNRDMTEQEAKLMKEHSIYWRGLQDKGMVPIFGPVLDPKGVWGLGIIEIEDESEATKLTEGDPTVKAGLCTLEIYPLLAVVKK